MTLQKQLGFWLAAFLVVVLLIYVLADVLLPFVAGLALAYLLDPLASRLERMGLSRLVATIGILSMFVLLFVLALVLLAPVLVQQLGAFMARVPQYLTQLQAIISERGAPLLERLGMGSVAGAGLQDAQKLFAECVRQTCQAGGYSLLELPVHSGRLKETIFVGLVSAKIKSMRIDGWPDGPESTSPVNEATGRQRLRWPVAGHPHQHIAHCRTGL